MVKAAVGHIKKVGTNQAYTDFTAKQAPFYDRDLYVVVYSLQGKIFAHGQNKKMVGKKMLDLKDPNGKPFVRERVELARSKGTFWQDYKFTDPISKKGTAESHVLSARRGDSRLLGHLQAHVAIRRANSD